MSFHNIRGRGASRYETTTLISLLFNLEQYSQQDITILTENHEDKIWVEEMLKDKYATQPSTQFPVEHVVVDTLDNFEGLESPVILFIIPQTWGVGYVGSLRYRLCVATRAISRLEFLLPLDASQRQRRLRPAGKDFNTDLGAGLDSLNTACQVDATQDRVTARLQEPQGVEDMGPTYIAVLGDTVLVVYTGIFDLGKKVVMFRPGVSISGKVLPRPEGMGDVSGLTTDHHSSFLLVGVRTVYVLDISGNLTHTILAFIPGYRLPWDCTVVGEQLWVGCDTGDIIVMSSQ